MAELTDYSRHSPYSDPGPFAALLRERGPDLDGLCAVTRNLIAHYREEVPDLPASRRSEIDSRWLSVILATDQARFGTALDRPRPLSQRVAGCCRDRALVLVGALREHGIPARSRVGFAGYFTPDFHPDHVVAELWDGSRWVRVDPELLPGQVPFDPHDIPTGSRAPFETAAEAWLAYRSGLTDPDTYGVGPGSDFAGTQFIYDEVLYEVAHRFGDELLLWDSWGLMGEQGQEELVDRVARLVVAADGGDQSSEAELERLYRADDRLHPGETVVQHSPYGLPPVTVRLDRSPDFASR